MGDERCVPEVLARIRLSAEQVGEDHPDAGANENDPDNEEQDAALRPGPGYVGHDVLLMHVESAVDVQGLARHESGVLTDEI